MKQWWTRYAERFEARSLRERILITFTVLAVIVMFGYLGIIEAPLIRLKIAERQLTQQKAELVDIQQKMIVIQTRADDQNTAERAGLERARRQIADINSRLKVIGEALVAPNKVGELLEEILKRNRRVQLISLHNLPVADLVEHKEIAGTERINPADSQAMNALKQGGVSIGKDRTGHDIESVEGPLFKHGVEIIVAGSYGDLMVYLAELEKMPQRVLWNSVKLSVEAYPRARMTLTVYTLSLDRAWLTV
jgi:MSHA biogenesis protein MshJ